MPIKVDIVDSSSQVRVKPKSKEEVNVGYGCNATGNFLNNKIDKEIQDRKDADAYLQEQIDNISAEFNVDLDYSNRILTLNVTNESGELITSSSANIDAYSVSEVDTLLNAKADLINGKVPASQLPSYVDDVLEYPTYSDFPAVGESGIIYVAIDTGKTYRWSGSEYIVIGSPDALQKVDSLSEVPNNELGLYIYDELNEETNNYVSSHIIEVVKEDHEGGEVSFEKITTTNNTQLNPTSFMSQFSNDLNAYISISELTNVYSLYYSAMDVPFNGIRIGTKNVGTINLTALQECNVVIYKYFSYNAQTGQKNYDTNAEFVIDDELVYDFESDDTPVTVTLSAGNHTISSGGQNMRVILTAFEVSSEPYSTFEKKELARVEDVEAVQNNLDTHITTSTERFRQDEALIQKNADDIVLTNEKIGSIQIYQVYNNLPQPGEQFLNKIFRYNEVLYQCVKDGDGVHKEWPFDITGTAEIVYGTDGRTYEAFMNEVGNEFKDYYEIPREEEQGQLVLDANKLYRNNGSLKLGSSSSVGRVTFQSIADLPITALKVGVKAYRADRPSCIYIEDNEKAYSPQLIENSVEETLISLTYENEGDLDYLDLESVNNYTDTSGDEPVTIQCDSRVIITRLIVDFGEVNYIWKSMSGAEMTYEQTMNILKGIDE